MKNEYRNLDIIDIAIFNIVEILAMDANSEFYEYHIRIVMYCYEDKEIIHALYMLHIPRTTL